MMTAERRHKRFTVMNMNISARTLAVTQAELLNISMGGACVSSKKSIKLGGKQLLKLEDGKTQLTIPGTVIWESLSGSERNSRGEIVPVYKVGIAFTNIPPDKLLRLKDFIRVSAVPEERKIDDHFSPSFLRFKVLENEKTLMYHADALLVKKISLGGMLVELDHCMEIDKKFPMALFLPNDELPIRFTARIASCLDLSAKELKSFDIGIEFLAISDKDRLRLNKFINRLSEGKEATR